MMRRTGSSVGLALAAGLVWMTPAVAAEAVDTMTLSPVVPGNGVPAGVTEEQWTGAQGTAAVVERRGGTDTIELDASGLVPNGVYTIWWVGRGTDASALGPGGGTPANEFTADAAGHAATTITVETGSGYRQMAVAYHADGRTYGDEPGEQSFTHLIGPWPGADGS